MARNNPREDAELEKSFRSVAGKYANRRRKPKKSNTGVLIGIAVSGVVLLAALIGLIVLFASLRRAKRR